MLRVCAALGFASIFCSFGSRVARSTEVGRRGISRSEELSACISRSRDELARAPQDPMSPSVLHISVVLFSRSVAVVGTASVVLSSFT